MHHRPSSPPLSARITGWSLLFLAGLRRMLPTRPGRLALGAALTTAVVGLVLAIPVISGVGAPAVELDSSSTESTPGDGNSPVIMGLDGRPAGSADFAGVTTSGSAPASSSPEGGTVAAEAAEDAEDTADTADTEDLEDAEDTAAPASAASPATPAPGTTAERPASTSSAGGTTGTPAGSPATTAPGTTRPAPPSTPSTPPPPAPAGAPAEVSDPASEVLTLINARRAALGCTALVTDTGLAGAARGHSTATSAGGAPELGGLVGAVAQGADASSVVAGLLADGTGAPLLDCARTSAGIAVVGGWWTVFVA